MIRPFNGMALITCQRDAISSWMFDRASFHRGDNA